MNLALRDSRSMQHHFNGRNHNHGQEEEAQELVAHTGQHASAHQCPDQDAQGHRSSNQALCYGTSLINGPVQPPWVKPPSGSSSGPPSACMTLSNDTNSETTIFRMISS